MNIFEKLVIDDLNRCLNLCEKHYRAIFRKHIDL